MSPIAKTQTYRIKAIRQRHLLEVNYLQVEATSLVEAIVIARGMYDPDNMKTVVEDTSDCSYWPVDADGKLIK